MITILPIVARELRVASRRAATYWTRSGAAAVMIIWGVWLATVMRDQRPHEFGKALFMVLTGTAGFFCLISGVRHTADCLSREKRDGTLGLLFLTDLKGHDVILGKLAANSMHALHAILAVLPMLGIPLLLGGVTLAEFGRIGIAIMNTLFFSLSAGLMVSAFSRSAQSASTWTMLVIFGIGALFPACGAWLSTTGFRPWKAVFFVPSPGCAHVMAYDMMYRFNASLFWISTLAVHFQAWAFLFLASVIVPHKWQDQAVGPKPKSWRERWRDITRGALGNPLAFRAIALNKNPFFWVASRSAIRVLYPWIALFTMAAAWTLGWWKYRHDWLTEPVYVLTGAVLTLLFKMWFSSETTRQLSQERQEGTLELLLSTELSVRDILRGQLLALKRQFAWPLAVVAILLLILMDRSTAAVVTDSERHAWQWLWVGHIGMMFADLVTIYWLGMWIALTSSNAPRAAGNTLSLVLGIPFFCMLMLVLARILLSTAGGPDPSPKSFFVAWFFFGFATDFGLSLWARHKLLTEFRSAASMKHGPKRSFWRAFLGGKSGAA